MIFIDNSNTITYLLPLPNNDQNIDEVLVRNLNDAESIQSKQEAWVLKEEFVGSNDKAQKKGIKKIESDVRYLTSNKSRNHTEIMQLNEEILFEGLYKKIDMNLLHKGESVEKIFSIHKNGNPSDIKVKVNGSSSLEVNSKGELVVKTQKESYTFSKPVAWQGTKKKQFVDVEYWTDGTTYGFSVAKYDTSETLYIDPEIVSTYLGKMTTYTRIKDIATDSEGNIFVVGSVMYNSYPVVAGSYDITFDGSRDGVVSKLNSSLTQIIASTFIGGANAAHEEAFKVLISENNDIIVGLETKSGTFPTTEFAYDRSHNGSADTALIVMTNDLSQLKYSTFIGGSGNETLRDIKFDGSGNIIFVGNSSYSTTNYPTTATAYQRVNKGGADAYISIISPDLSTLLYSTLLGVGNLYDYASRVTVKPNGDIVVGGSTENAGFPTTVNAYDRSYNGGLTDFYVAIFDSQLSTLKASTLLGGNNGNAFETLTGLKILPSGEIAISGYTQASDYPTTSGTYDTSYGGAADSVISIFNHDLSNLNRSTYFGGSGTDVISQLEMDSTGMLYLTGYTASSDFPLSSDAYDSTLSSTDVFLTKLSNNLTAIEYSTYIGGSKSDSASSIFLDEDGTSYLCGSTDSLNFPVTQGAIQTTNYTSIAFVLKVPRNLSGLNAANWVKYTDNTQDDNSLGYGGIELSKHVLSVFGAQEIDLNLSYNSILLDKGSMGVGWSHNYEISLNRFESGNVSIMWNPNKISNFFLKADGSYSPDVLLNPYEKLVKLNDEYHLYDRELNHYVFNNNGLLLSRETKEGLRIDFSYNANGKLSQILEPISQRFINFEYNSENFLSRITDSHDRYATFTYDEGDRLIQFSDVEQNTFNYEYNALSQVISIKDAFGKALTAYEYDTKGRVISHDTDDLSSSKSLFSYTENINNKTVNVTTVDERGNSTLKVYNAKYDLLKSTDSLNKSISFNYDKFGNIVKSVDANGFETYFEWDTNGNLIGVTDQNNRSSQFEYDNNKNIVSFTNSLGASKYYEYDTSNKLTKFTDTLGNEISYVYDANGLLSSVQKPSNAVILFENELGQVKKIKQSGTGDITLNYDNAGRIISKIDGTGNVTEYHLNNYDQVEKMVDARLYEQSYVYNHLAQLTSTTDMNGNTTYYAYNNKGLLASKEDPTGGITTYEYDDHGNLTAVVSPMGNTKYYEYNALNQLIEERDYYGNQKNYFYDNYGNVNKITDSNNQAIFTGTYDSYGNLVTSSDGLNRTYNNSYDSLNRLISVSDNANNVKTYSYDSESQLIGAINEMGYQSGASFDEDGNCISITDQSNNTTNFDYDTLGRLVSIIDASGYSKVYSYNQSNKVSSFENGRHQVTNFTYDEVGNLASLSDNEEFTKFTYDPNGNLLTTTSTSGNKSRTYDNMNRLISYTDTKGDTIEYTYNLDSAITSIKYPDGRLVNYEYDLAGRLVQVKDWDNNTTTYAYDGNNRLIVINKPDGSYQHNEYNAANQITHISIYNKLDQLIYDVAYSYDAIGNLINENESTTSLDRVNNYNYSSQLLSQTSTLNQQPSNNYNYTYDSSGNIVSQEKNGITNVLEYTLGNRVLSIDGVQVVHDNDGNITSYQLNGVPKTFIYDSRNRLISHSSSEYEYDSENQRIAKTYGTNLTEYTIDINGTLPKVLVKTENNESTYYVYGIGLISQTKGTSYNIYHFDNRGNTVLSTNLNGDVTDTISYGPFGNVESRTGSSDIDFLFSGQFGIETDENGLIYLNDRYYDPSIGRFLNEDPYSLKYQDILKLNLYAYGDNNPLSNVDPTGNFLETVFDAFAVLSSAVAYFKDPTVLTLTFLLADTAAVFIPFAVAPSTGSKIFKFGDKIIDTFKGGSEVVWDTWESYKKVTKMVDGEEKIYAQIGERLFTPHAVNRMMPYGKTTLGRSVSPYFVEDVLTNGKLIDSKMVNGVLRETWQSGTVQVITENSRKTVITIITK